MYIFTALIYDGYKQHLVSGTYDNNSQFEVFLTQRFNVYVCLWLSKEHTAHTTNNLENRSLTGMDSNVLNVRSQ